VDKFPDSNLATPIHIEVDKLDTLHNGNVSNGVEGGHLHATKPNSQNGPARAEINIVEGGQLGHMQFFRSGQVRNGDGSQDDEGIQETARNIAALPPEEQAALRAEFDAAPRDDPLLAHDRAALALFDAKHVSVELARSTAMKMRERVGQWPS
jgi:hypothetical protein